MRVNIILALLDKWPPLLLASSASNELCTGVQGFMGESYNNVRASTARKLQAMEPAWAYSNNASDYELPRFFTI